MKTLTTLTLVMAGRQEKEVLTEKKSRSLMIKQKLDFYRDGVIKKILLHKKNRVVQIYPKVMK